METDPGYYIVVYVKPHLVYVGRSDRGRLEGHDVEACWPFNVPLDQVDSYQRLSHDEVCALLKDKVHATTIL